MKIKQLAIEGLCDEPVLVITDPVVKIGRLGHGADLQIEGQLRSMHVLIVREVDRIGSRWNYRIIPMLDAETFVNRSRVSESQILAHGDRIGFGESNCILGFLLPVEASRTAVLRVINVVGHGVRLHGAISVQNVILFDRAVRFSTSATASHVIADRLPAPLSLEWQRISGVNEKTLAWRIDGGAGDVAGNVRYRVLSVPDFIGVLPDGMVDGTVLHKIQGVPHESLFQELLGDYIADSQVFSTTLRVFDPYPR